MICLAVLPSISTVIKSALTTRDGFPQDEGVIVKRVVAGSAGPAGALRPPSTKWCKWTEEERGHFFAIHDARPDSKVRPIAMLVTLRRDLLLSALCLVPIQMRWRE